MLCCDYFEVVRVELRIFNIFEFVFVYYDVCNFVQKGETNYTWLIKIFEEIPLYHSFTLYKSIISFYRYILVLLKLSTLRFCARFCTRGLWCNFRALMWWSFFNTDISDTALAFSYNSLCLFTNYRIKIYWLGLHTTISIVACKWILSWISLLIIISNQII